jgi:beta-glucanase (GH16 family)
MDNSFALADDQSFPTDGENIEFYDNKARIVTKAETKKGLQWRSNMGFVLENFEYTSGMISSSKSFRQKYGVFKAKVKMAAGSVAQAFWMVSDEMLPHIDVARFENGKLYSNYFYGKGNSPHKSLSKTGGAKYGDTYFIYTLEWSPNKLVWKINDKVFKTQTSGVPQEEMSINFSANLKEDASGNGLPSAMEIDWVRAYKLKGQS